MANISTIARSANVVTVTTSSAHGLAVNQGFSIQGVSDASFDVNSTVATVSNSTTFTFAQTGSNASLGAGGTTSPAKQIVILRIDEDDAGIRISYILWTTTTKGYPVTNATSNWSGASQAEIAALSAGTTIEVQNIRTFSQGDTKASIQSSLVNEYNFRQAQLAASTQPGQFFGGFYDGAWSF